MYLVYLDESGNTGTDLKDTQQPIFVLAALIVPETGWQPLEADLISTLRAQFSELPVDELEVHGSNLRIGRGPFKESLCADELVFAISGYSGEKHGLKLVYRAIEKKRFERWIDQTFGPGVEINPYRAAFPLVALRVVDDYLAALPGSALGMFISDENTEIIQDIEKSIRLLARRGGYDPARPNCRERLFH